jgi:tellurite resistance protein
MLKAGERGLCAIPQKENPLPQLPVGLFGSTVALAGLANALNQGISLYGLPHVVGSAVMVVCWLIFVFLILCYLLKYHYYPGKVAEELTHPVTAHFLGTFFISAVLLAALSAPVSLLIARLTWMAGAGGGVIFICIMTSRSFRGDGRDEDAVPPVLIPGLTALNAATAGANIRLGKYGEQIDSMLFAIGIVYTFTFFIIITRRLMLRGPLSSFLNPTLLLMCTPFEVGFQCFYSLTGTAGLFASTIFYFGFFIFAVLLFRVFTRKTRFELSWWGSCFSVGALANATLLYANISHNELLKAIAAILLTFLSGLVVVTFYCTIRQFTNYES